MTAYSPTDIMPLSRSAEFNAEIFSCVLWLAHNQLKGLGLHVSSKYLFISNYHVIKDDYPVIISQVIQIFVVKSSGGAGDGWVNS